MTLDQIGALLKPFLSALALSPLHVVKERIVDRIFDPLLESNVTAPDSDETSDEVESEEENLAHVDGGKMSKRSRKAVEALANEKYTFPAFNILIYAENYIYPQASASATGEDPLIVENNRELLYNLYYKALKLEPEPKHPELTFSQRQLMNRARKFVTFKMKKRMEMRENKKTMKDKRNLKKQLSDKIMNQLRQ